MILDEPTSALDPATARALERAAARALAGRLERGRVSERGDHVRLLAGSGRYARLWAVAGQSGGQTHD